MAKPAPTPVPTSTTAPTTKAAVLRVLLMAASLGYASSVQEEASMRAVQILGLLALAGCATTSTTDLRRVAVSASYKTSKPAAVVAACFAEGLTKWGAPSVYPTDAGTAVSFTTAGNSLLLIDIAAGGKVTVRRANGLVSFRQGVEACL
jgi:hypothetical protein